MKQTQKKTSVYLPYEVASYGVLICSALLLGTGTMVHFFGVTALDYFLPLETLNGVLILFLMFSKNRERRKSYLILEPPMISFKRAIGYKSPQLFGKVIAVTCLVPWASLAFLTSETLFHFGSLFHFFLLALMMKKIFISPNSVFIHKFVVVTPMVLFIIHCMALGWLTAEGYTDYWPTAYNKAFYWSITTLTTVGYGDMTPSTNFSRLYTTVVMVLGVGVYGVVFGNISRLIINRDRHEEAKKEKINDLKAFLTHYQIAPRLRNEVLTYYHELYSQHLSDKDNVIISELPEALQADLRIYMKIKLLKDLSLFKTSSTDCLKMVAQKLVSLSVSPNQHIIREGDQGEEMYIMAHGEVDVIVDKKIVASMSKGQFFGELALVQNITRTADVVSRSYCEVYRLTREDFWEIIEQHPALEKQFMRDYQKAS